MYKLVPKFIICLFVKNKRKIFGINEFSIYLRHDKSLLAGIARKDMKIYNNSHINLLARESGKTTDDFSVELIEELVNLDIVHDDPLYWGEKLERGDCETDQVREILEKLGISKVTDEHIESFFNLYFMGDGNCPSCGSDMELYDAEYRNCGGDGYLTSYITEAVYE